MAVGRKTGGRQTGTPNAVTASLREQVEQAAGGTPLPVLLAEIGAKAMQQGDDQLALAAFAKAATYVYPRLQAVTVRDDTPHMPPVVIRFPDGTGIVTRHGGGSDRVRFLDTTPTDGQV